MIKTQKLDYTQPIFVVHCHAVDSLRGWSEIGCTNSPILAKGFADQFNDGVVNKLASDIYEYNVKSIDELADAVYHDMEIRMDEDDTIEVRTSYNDTQYYTTEHMSMNDYSYIYDYIEMEIVSVGKACARLQTMAEYLTIPVKEFKPFLEFIFGKYITRVWTCGGTVDQLEEIDKAFLSDIGLNTDSCILDVFDTEELIYENNYSVGG